MNNLNPMLACYAIISRVRIQFTEDESKITEKKKKKKKEKKKKKKKNILSRYLVTFPEDLHS